MLFNSYAFLLVFLPCAIIAYRLADPYPALRMPVLILLSFIFYVYWDVRFLPLLIGSILFNWFAARWYVATKRGSIIALAIIANLALLGLFKYANFFTGTVTSLFGIPIVQLQWVLPLGISFFTFHHIMYLVDLRRGKAPAYALDRYALYIAFFPQAIAGPIARWHEVMHQFGRAIYAPGWQRRFALGLTFITIGLAEKTLLADPIARVIDPIYQQAASGPIGGQAWPALGFGFQVLFDFSGYSDVAIGTALLFGVQLPFNFNAPYRAGNLQEFWQRWHMTLMAFLRDYLFLRLADARILPRRFRLYQHFAAMLVTMTLAGLWHGASWTFVLWGFVHGCGLVIVSLWRRHGPRLPFILASALTVTFALLTAVLFRAGSLQAAFNIWQGLAARPDIGRIADILPIVTAALCALLLPASQDIIARLTEQPRRAVAIALALVGVIVLTRLGNLDSYEFVYFQF